MIGTVNSITNRLFHQNKNKQNNPKCLICLDEIEHSSDIASFNCRFPDHVVHQACMRKYQEYNYIGCLNCDAGKNRLQPQPGNADNALALAAAGRRMERILAVGRMERMAEAMEREAIEGAIERAIERERERAREINNNVIIKTHVSLLMSFIMIASQHTTINAINNAMDNNSERPENQNAWAQPSILPLLCVASTLLLLLTSRAMERANIYPKTIESTLKTVNALYSGMAAANVLAPSMRTHLAHITPIAISPSAVTVCTGLAGAILPTVYYQSLRWR